MLAEIITIGDEILIGQIVDTNSAWMAQQLNLAGISVKQITSVSDDRQHILKALDEARSRADLILITGGLGPTKDDITKKTLCEYFKTKLIFSNEVYENVESIFHSYGKEVTPINRLQAEIPENCTPILNKLGTAPGMWFDENVNGKVKGEKGKKIFVSMPGVPYEMKGIMSEFVIPELKKRFRLPHIIHKTILTQGVGESFLATIIEKWEDSLGALDIKLAYLPSPGMVRLRMSTSGNDEKKLKETVEKKVEELRPLIHEYFFGFEEYGKEKDTFASIIGNLLRERKETVSSAESCTGGYISHLLTSVSGSSDYYVGSIIAYAYATKTLELGVPEKLLNEKGAVCQEVVELMAKNLREKFKTTYAISVSGIAGPNGGTKDKPVGTVWISVASPTKIVSEKFLFGNNRERNIQKAANAALNMLRKMIEE